MPEQILIGSLPKGLEILKGCKNHVEMVFCIIIKSSIYYMWKRMEVFNEDMSETCYRVQNYTRLVEAYSSCLWGQEQTYEQKSLTFPHSSVICYFEHLELLSPFWSAIVVPVRGPMFNSNRTINIRLEYLKPFNCMQANDLAHLKIWPTVT